jgi:hypothetical protein
MTVNDYGVIKILGNMWPIRPIIPPLYNGMTLDVDVPSQLPVNGRRRVNYLLAREGCPVPGHAWSWALDTAHQYEGKTYSGKLVSRLAKYAFERDVKLSNETKASLGSAVSYYRVKGAKLSMEISRKWNPRTYKNSNSCYFSYREHVRFQIFIAGGFGVLVSGSGKTRTMGIPVVGGYALFNAYGPTRITAIAEAMAQALGWNTWEAPNTSPAFYRNAKRVHVVSPDDPTPAENAELTTWPTPARVCENKCDRLYRCAPQFGSVEIAPDWILCQQCIQKCKDHDQYTCKYCGVRGLRTWVIVWKDWLPHLACQECAAKHAWLSGTGTYWDNSVDRMACRIGDETTKVATEIDGPFTRVDTTGHRRLFDELEYDRRWRHRSNPKEANR